MQNLLAYSKLVLVFKKKSLEKTAYKFNLK